jgi:hypothetical protein
LTLFFINNVKLPFERMRVKLRRRRTIVRPPVFIWLDRHAILPTFRYKREASLVTSPKIISPKTSIQERNQVTAPIDENPAASCADTFNETLGARRRSVAAE